MSNQKPKKNLKPIKKIIKFGGSCLREPSSLRNIVSILKQEKERVALVVSAVSGITDLLIDAYHLSLSQDRNYQGIMAQIKNRHLLLASELLSLSHFGQYQAKSQEILKQLERTLKGLSLTGESTPSLKARVLSAGERLSAFLLAAVLEEAGFKCRVFETDRVGLVANQPSEEAEVVLEKFDFLFRKTAEEINQDDYIPVFTGFFGITEEGKLALFGRNGSDYSAAVIARGFQATVLTTYKDVPGFLTADPEFIPEARPVNRLSRKEAAELCYFGARILHPKIWQPLEGLETTVEIKEFSRPESLGTIISNSSEKAARIIKSLSVNQNIALVKVEGPGVGFKPGLIGKIGSRLAEKDLNILTVLTSQTCINLLMSPAAAELARTRLVELKEPAFRKITLEKNLALIACVGEGLRETPGVASHLLSILARKGINLELFSSGGSEVALYLVVKKQDAGRALHLLHEKYLGPGEAREEQVGLTITG